MFLNMRPFVETSPHSFPPLAFLSFPCTLTSFLLHLPFFLPSPPHHPFPFVGCDYFPDKDVSSTTHANPSKLTFFFFFFLCLHSIILDINSRLLSNRKIWIGPQLSLCPSFQPIERSVIMVIGHSLILELLFLF